MLARRDRRIEQQQGPTEILLERGRQGLRFSESRQHRPAPRHQPFAQPAWWCPTSSQNDNCHAAPATRSASPRSLRHARPPTGAKVQQR